MTALSFLPYPHFNPLPIDAICDVAEVEKTCSTKITCGINRR